ncbi:hypothetical protein UFOVP728_47 [uncultured Caudovirales phage]|uniref:Uncharacterized protein n=1 Tax=uncultured Caudovirales phage TaxID=2100421 RepID=A0A6J5NVQ6_9CAUD|nr:hypothetical protein UFOVP728_47 [uncultured Caudovirales phage]
MAAISRIFNGPFLSDTSGAPIGVLGLDGREYLLPVLPFNATPATAQPASFNPASVALTGGTINGVTLNGAPSAQLAYVFARDFRYRAIPSSGSSNATGQITLTTAMPYAPPAAVPAFIYLPAGVVTAGSQGTGANFYQVTFSSTTVCQITGTGIVTANAAYTQTTGTQIPFATIAVPGNTLGTTGSLVVTARWSFPNNANTKNCRLLFGGMVVSQNTNANTLSHLEQQWMSNRGVTNHQVGGWNGFQMSYGPQGSAIYNYLTIDTTVSQNYIIDAALTVATDYVVLDGYSVLLVP